MGMIVNRGSYDYDGGSSRRSSSSYSSSSSYPSPSYGTSSSAPMTTTEAAAVTAAATCVLGVMGLVGFAVWAGPAAVWSAVTAGCTSLAAAVGLPMPLMLILWGAVQGAFIGACCGLVSAVRRGEGRTVGQRAVDFVAAVAVGTALGLGLGFLGLFSAPAAVAGEGLLAHAGVPALFAGLGFGGGGGPPSAASFAALALLVLVLMLAVVLIGWLLGWVSGGVLGAILLGAAQSASKDAAKAGASTYLREGRLSPASAAARSAGLSGIVTGALTALVGLHLAGSQTPGLVVHWAGVLAADAVGALVALAACVPAVAALWER
jgi:hypothetical protein